MSLMVGDTFAGFRIVGLLGSGRMGRLYRADRPGSADHALRVLPPDLTADQRYRARFVEEAHLAAGLSHPNLVRIHDHGEVDDQFWIAMDFIDGIGAAELVRERYPTGMPPAQVADIVDGIASALDHAHLNGLLHSAVTPANVLISSPDSGLGRAFLAGIGIARPIDDSTGLTATDTELDAVAYTAPEQLIDEATDERSDQYALACTAFHLLTGSLPYESFNAAVIINKHVMAPPPSIGERRAEFAHLDQVFAAALAKDPNDRYNSCQDFAGDLARGLLSSTDGPTPVEPTLGAAPARPRLPRRQPLSEPPVWTGSPWWRRRMRRFSGKRWSTRKIMIAALASVGILAMAATTLAAVVMPLVVGDSGQSAPPSTAAAPTPTTPAIVIKPLAVRPVVDVPLQARPEDCPPIPLPAPPQEPMRACDVDKVAVYQLGPVGLRLNLTGATSARLPLSEFHTVQMAMDPASSAAFAQYTAANIGKQLALVRDGVVLAAPAINQPIDGQSIQISGELTGPAAETIARMLRDGT